MDQNRTSVLTAIEQQKNKHTWIFVKLLNFTLLIQIQHNITLACKIKHLVTLKLKTSLKFSEIKR